MPQPFSWENQPEAAGPMTEPRSRTAGPALDIQALQQGTIRLPQLNPAALEHGDYVPVSRTEAPLDPERRERERHEAALSYDAGRDALRAMFENAARGAGADPRVARRTADELLRQLPEPAPEPAPAASPAKAAEPVTDPPAEPEVRAAEPDPPATTAAEPVLAAVPDAPPETEPAAVRPRKQQKETS
jgi:hypothetical protein